MCQAGSGKEKIFMDQRDELKEAEAHLERAEADLKAAEVLERNAEHEVDEALEEVRELESLKHDEILLKVATPNGLFRGVFRDTATVATVIDVIVDKKKLDRKDTFELLHGETPLQPTNRTLESFGLKRKAELELVATGSGV
jgi:hypothetical protein